MSFQRIYKNKIHSKPPKVDIVLETNLQQVPECSADRFSSAAIKNQNFFIDDEDLNLLNTKHNSTNMKTLIQQEQTITSQLLPDQQSPATELLTENGKEDGPLSSDVRLKEDEDQLYENQPSPENKRLTKLNLLRRQDSIPVVVSEFHQIESHLDDDRNNGFKNEDDNNSERTSGIMVTSNTNFVPSKFAPDHLKKNISQATFTLKSPKQNTSGDQYIQSLSNKGEQKSIETDRYAKKKWNKLSYLFQSILLFNREEVKNINNPADIFDEIATFQLRQMREKPLPIWDISKQDFAREAFQTIRKVQVFCECAAIGSQKHIDFMREMILQDPKRYLLEPDDPSFLTNHKNNRGHTPLYIAAKYGNLGVVKLLLEFKANLLIQSTVSPLDKVVELPLEAAVKWGHEAVVEYLLEQKKYSQKDVKKCLSLARTQNMKDIIKKNLGKSSSKQGWRILIRCFG